MRLTLRTIALQTAGGTARLTVQRWFCGCAIAQVFVAAMWATVSLSGVLYQLSKNASARSVACASVLSYVFQREWNERAACRAAGSAAALCGLTALTMYT